MRIQGASEIAAEGLVYLKKIGKKHGFGRRFEEECNKMLKTRPTEVVLYNAINGLLANRSVREIDVLIISLKTARQGIANSGRKMFNGKKVVMTHCHSHEVMSILLKNKNMIREVYVTETSPFHQGLLTAKELAGKMKVNYIVDSAAGYYMDKVDFVLVGSDSLRKDGFVNKIGTLPLCVIAKEFNKPVYVASDTFKIDKRKHLYIEQRPTSEVHRSMIGIKILNPVFDVTPWRYVDKIIMEDRIIKPNKLVFK